MAGAALMGVSSFARGQAVMPASPPPLASTQIDDAFAGAARLTSERLVVAAALARATEIANALAVEGAGIARDAASYRRAVADHDAACEGRDWRLPPYGTAGRARPISTGSRPRRWLAWRTTSGKRPPTTMI